MKQLLLVCFAVLICFPISFFGQIPTTTLVQIVKAEDERRFDAGLENLLKHPNEKIRARAALAVGRIGDERSLPALVNLLDDNSISVQTMAAFAVGEIESAKGSDAVMAVLKNRDKATEVRARALEAAGKIAAAVAQTDKPRAEELGAIILSSLDDENIKPKPDVQTILLGLTAVLRARPANGEFIAAKFLTNTDARVRADAANTLARLRAKNANEQFRKLLSADADAIVRANAARALGAAEDKTALDLLLKSAVNDTDLRVRVSAIRSLGNLKDAKVADALLNRAEKLLREFASSKISAIYPKEKNELLEIATALGKLLPNTNNERAVRFLESYCKLHEPCSSEVEIAHAQISPAKYMEKFTPLLDSKKVSPSQGLFLFTKGNKAVPVSGIAQGLGELANNPTPEIKSKAAQVLRFILENFVIEDVELPIVLQSYARFKFDDYAKLLGQVLQNPFYNNLFTRAAAAEILGEQPVTKENIEALKTAFTKALLTDKRYNDAQLAILDALYKLDKKESVGSLLIALNATDYLVRKRAFQLLEDKDLQKDFPGIPASLENARSRNKDKVLPYLSYSGTKLGQILNTDADYLRAVSRKSAKAVFTTSKGNFTINFFPQDAPLTVDNFIKLAKSNYFNNVAIHRVVPNFVMQDGDPRGDGNGGPGWQIRCEINEFPYERGAVGMALSGKDTGGSQWFVTHSRQPHLDGGYTVFGGVNETDMKIVDNLARGDKILNVKIVEGNLPQRTQRTQRKKK